MAGGGFFGVRTVKADLRKHQATGKVVPAVLSGKESDGTPFSVSYANAYAWPSPENSGVGGKGRAWNTGRITLWRVWPSIETQAPRPDDTVAMEIEGEATDVRLNSVTPRLNADESRGFAVYDCEYGTT